MHTSDYGKCPIETNLECSQGGATDEGESTLFTTFQEHCCRFDLKSLQEENFSPKTTQGEIGGIHLSKRPTSEVYPIQSRCPSMVTFQDLVEVELKELATNPYRHREDSISTEERMALKTFRDNPDITICR